MILFSVWFTFSILIIFYFLLIYHVIKFDKTKEIKEKHDTILSAFLIGFLGLTCGIFLYEFLNWYQKTF